MRVDHVEAEQDAELHVPSGAVSVPRTGEGRQRFQCVRAVSPVSWSAPSAAVILEALGTPQLSRLRPRVRVPVSILRAKPTDSRTVSRALARLRSVRELRVSMPWVGRQPQCMVSTTQTPCSA